MAFVMKAEEREKLHRSRLAQIERVQVVAGSGNEARVNHERTLIERARLMGEEIQSHLATERGIEAFERLVDHAADRKCPYRRDIAQFLESVWNGKPLALGTLRVPDARIGDDMIAVLDAYRHGRCDLALLADGGPRRVSLVLRAARL
jgi:hypothetical protein